MTTRRRRRSRNRLRGLGALINVHLPPQELLTTSSSIRFVTYTAIGILIGWFAHSNRELVDRLRTAEERDSLTGLLNPRFRHRAVGRVELGMPFGLNDTEGHGNDLLRRAADLLSRKLEHGDQLARIGGDEFAVITSTPRHRCCPRPLRPPDRGARRAGAEHELRLGGLPARRRQLAAAGGAEDAGYAGGRAGAHLVRAARTRTITVVIIIAPGMISSAPP